MTTFIQQSYRIAILIALQAFLFSRVILFDLGVTFIYIFFILFIPIQWPKWLQYILAFITGLVIDILTGTYGLHAISATVIVALKNIIARIILPSYNEEEWESIDLFDRDFGEIAPYAMILSFIYCLVFFSLDFFSFQSIQRWIGHVLVSTLFTFISLIIYRYIFALSNHKLD